MSSAQLPPPAEGDRGVAGFCPACGFSSLMLAAGGYVTCMRLECPHPEAASEQLGTRALGRYKAALAGVTSGEVQYRVAALDAAVRSLSPGHRPDMLTRRAEDLLKWLQGGQE